MNRVASPESLPYRNKINIAYVYYDVTFMLLAHDVQILFSFRCIL